jgi:hypothetical protein
MGVLDGTARAVWAGSSVTAVTIAVSAAASRRRMISVL